MKVKVVTIRAGSGPVLLDYPYVYELDGRKLYCNNYDSELGRYCDGEIDYDPGFNHLVCSKCSKIYLARQLQDDTINNKIIIKGGSKMKIVIKEGDRVVCAPISSEEVMTRPEKRPVYKGLRIRINNPGDAPIYIGGETEIKPEVKAKEPVREEIKIDLKNDTNVSKDDLIKYNESPAEINNDADSDVNKVLCTKYESTEEAEQATIEDIATEVEVEDTSISDTDDEDDSDKSEEVSDDTNERKEEIVQNNRPARAPNGRFISTGNKSNKKNKKKAGGPKVGSTFIPTSE